MGIYNSRVGKERGTGNNFNSCIAVLVRVTFTICIKQKDKPFGLDLVLLRCTTSSRLVFSPPVEKNSFRLINKFSLATKSES